MNFNRLSRDSYTQSQINGSVMWGFILCFSIIALAIIIGGNVTNYISVSGLLIVVGGVFAAMLVNFSYEDIKKALSSIRAVLYSNEQDPRVRIE